jgi:hypothetical protein
MYACVCVFVCVCVCKYFICIFDYVIYIRTNAGDRADAVAACMSVHTYVCVCMCVSIFLCIFYDILYIRTIAGDRADAVAADNSGYFAFVSLFRQGPARIAACHRAHVRLQKK